MEIIVEKNILAKELKSFLGIFEKKNVMDILENILIVVEKDYMVLTAFDMDICLTTTIENINVIRKGKITLVGKDFYELINSMPEGVIYIKEEENLQVHVKDKSGRINYKLLGKSSEEYPQLPKADFSSFIELEASLLRDLIEKNYYVVTNEIKFQLGGAILTIKKDLIEMAATDSFRLTYASQKVELYDFFYKNNLDKIDLLLSKKTLVEILKLIDEDGIVYLNYDKNNIYLKYKNKILSSRILNFKFPNYKSIMPNKYSYIVAIDKNKLINSFKRLMIFKSNINDVTLDFQKDLLLLHRVSPDRGIAKEEIDIIYNGPEFNKKFDCNNLFDGINHIDSDEITIQYNEDYKNFLFEPKDNKSKVNYKLTIVPMLKN